MRRLIFILLAIIGVSQAQTIQYIGAPTTTVISRGNFRTDSIFYLPKRAKLPTDTAALRYQISDSTVYVWTGSQWVKAGGGVGSLTGSGVAGYMSEFTTANNLDTTRLYHSAGRFSIGSTTISNGVFNVYGEGSYFDTLVKVGKGDILVGGTYNPHGATNNSSIVLNGSLGGALGFTNGVRQKAYIYSDTTDLYLRTVSSGRLLFGTRDSTRMLITTDGRLSLAAPASTFLQTARFNISDNSGDLMRVETNGNQRLYIGQDTLMLNTSSAGVIRLSRNNTSAAYINSSSELLINTETDAGAYPLQVNGTVLVSSIYTRNNTDVFLFGTNPAVNPYFQGTSGNALAFGTSGNPRLWITSGGNVGINTTSPSQQLHVNGNILTAAPSGGTAKPFKIGEAATVSPTSPNRTIRVEIDGTVYYLHAKTTND